MTDDFFLKKNNESEIVPLDEMFRGKYKKIQYSLSSVSISK